MQITKGVAVATGAADSFGMIIDSSKYAGAYAKQCAKSFRKALWLL